MRLLLGQLYQRRLMFDKAESEYRASLVLNESEDAWVDLGVLYLQERHLPEAERAFSRAVQLAEDPFPCTNNWRRWNSGCSIRRQRCGHSMGRRVAVRTGTAPNRRLRNCMQTLRMAAPTLMRMLSHMPQAIEFEEEAVRLNPGVAERWNKLADLLELNGQLDLSRQARQKALEFGASPR